MKFNYDNIQEGDILAVRSTTEFGKLIRATLCSYSNHTAIFLKEDDKWMIGEAVEPKSQLSNPRHYEELVSKEECWIRVLRVPKEKMNDNQRHAVCTYFKKNMLGLPYPLSVLRLWVFRFVNSLPWKIKGPWCTNIVWLSFEFIIRGILDTPQGKRKNNPTPRTIEKRAFAGVLEDVTNECVIMDA